MRLPSKKHDRLHVQYRENTPALDQMERHIPNLNFKHTLNNKHTPSKSAQ
jgi:hypothetical protein